MDKHPILQKLEDYLNNTSKEQLEKDWEELKQYQNIGPTMDEYFENLERRFKKPIKKLVLNIYRNVELFLLTRVD